MPDPITKRVRDSLKTRKKIVRDSTSRMEMVKILKKELGKENYNKIRTKEVKNVKLTKKQRSFISQINRLAKKEDRNRKKIGDNTILGRKKK
tara:strand:+ start:805 stop:1080 length:276 start_codon:yes stop_codon:yes gene_type:complete